MLIIALRKIYIYAAVIFSVTLSVSWVLENLLVLQFLWTICGFLVLVKVGEWRGLTPANPMRCLQRLGEGCSWEPTELTAGM